jgi:hypothetical protein
MRPAPTTNLLSLPVTYKVSSVRRDRVRLNVRSSVVLMDTEKPYLGHPSAILECLRLEEPRDRPILETDGGKDWLQNQTLSGGGDEW